MYVGVDVGTSLTKAVGYDADGAELCVHSVPTQLNYPGPGRVEQDADTVVDSVIRVVRAVVAELPHPPSLIAVTGQGDGCWLHDADGAPVRPAASWLDARAADVVRRWDVDGTADAILARNGGMVFPGASAAILAVLDREEPEALDRANTATHGVGLVFRRLTGERASDVSDASFPFLDPRRHDYDDEILRLCGLEHRRDLLPPVVGPAGPSAPLTAGAAELLGLPSAAAERTVVSAGPYDLLASARGSGVVQPGDGLLIVGTTLACQVVTDDPSPIPHRAGLLLGMWRPDRWMRAMPAMVGTASMDWLLPMVGTSFDELGTLMGDSPPGANGVRALPYWSASGERAPFVDASARGRLDGLHMGTTRADLVRGLAEGLAFAARHCFDAAGLTGRLAVCGGGAQSAAWMQLFADVLGRPLEAVDVGQAGAYGAVLSALDGRGQAPDSWPIPRHTIEPAADSRDQYDEAFEDYLRRVDRAREEWKDR
ncbi:FGGY-family carbohydrate kinase [Phytoactinopolyspora halotolerans]|uniref:Carbohydrate kinase n=1 Tax=Phytoactinopolyspora halotolerans TaxID=1981512 RepID=A0A6L9S894_9ACTN|nr:FGGY-family carbohydrate kinase [Phytoactinopolyspora halotolerans]NEE00748.1 carbohydrate kinase [Phytoactinopolyspora halotolerans]